MVSTGVCLKTDPKSLLRGAAQSRLGSQGETERGVNVKTPFISVGSFGELWEIGASAQVCRQPWGKPRRRGGGGEPRGVLEAPAGAGCGRRTHPASFVWPSCPRWHGDGSPATLLRHSPHQPCPSLLLWLGAPAAPLPPQHCPARNWES